MESFLLSLKPESGWVACEYLHLGISGGQMKPRVRVVMCCPRSCPRSAAPPTPAGKQAVCAGKVCILLQLLRVSTSPPSRFLGAPSEWARAGCPSRWSQDICTRYPRSQLRSSLVNTSLPHPRATPEPDPFGSGCS